MFPTRPAFRLPRLPGAAIAASFIALAAAAPAPAHAEGMSDGARAALRAEIRDYLLDNPEVIMEAIQELEKRRRADEAAGDAKLVASLKDELGNDGYSWIGGNPDGDVTVVEFLDYSCGYCKKAHEDVKALVRQDGDIRYVVKEFPILGEMSRNAAAAAMAALEQDPKKYAEYHDALMTFRGKLSDDVIWKLADDAGLDLAQLKKDAASPAIAERIQRTYALAKALRIEGTPTFVIGGQLVRGFVPLGQLQAKVAEVRKEEG